MTGDDDGGVRPRDWSARSEAWERWAERLGRTADNLNAPLLDAAALRPGERVLDLACGAGEPALSAARRLGDDGLVVATDLAPEMLAGTGRRVVVAGLNTVLGCAADMHELPFTDASFDAAVCRFGIMFCERVDLVFIELCRVLNAGGRAAFLVWGPLEANTMFSVIDATMTSLTGEGVPRDGLSPFRFAQAGPLSQSMRLAGFHQVDERDVHLELSAKPGTRFWRPNLEMTFGSTVTDLPAETREEIDQRMEAAFADRIRDGRYRLSVHARLVVGRVADGAKG